MFLNPSATPSHRAACSRDQTHHGSAASFTFKRALDRVDLTFDPPDLRE